MSKSVRVKGKSSICLTQDKINFESRVTESSLMKTMSRASLASSNTPLSSNSIANITLNFTKDSNFPKLFANSPMLFSFNAQPQTSKNSLRSSSSSFGLSIGSRTPSSSNLHSPTSQFMKESFNKRNFFRKSSEPKIDIGDKKIEKSKSRVVENWMKKELNSNISNSNGTSLYQSYASSFDTAQKTENIKVYIRLKPLFNQDFYKPPFLTRIDDKNIEMDGKLMAYDFVFPTHSQQEEVYEKIAKPIIQGIFDGFNGTIFAYGQTGSGKTYTIFGGETKQDDGLISRSIHHIFESLTEKCRLSISFLEIYREELIDLLRENKSELKIKETGGGVAVEGLTKMPVYSEEETILLVRNSLKNRRVASTKMNEKSSRSHTILTMYLSNMDMETKLCLIDLAGSEKADKAGVRGENFEEMKKINYSLSCLGNVINALVTRRKTDHIPFRDSKLTRLLKDSLSGKFRTSIIVNCSSDAGSEEETISSLKFADRAKKVKVTISKCLTKGKENVDYLHKVIEQLTTDLESTKRELTKYKEVYNVNNKQVQQNKEEETQLTTRTTIPSERAHIEIKMKKYDKENRNINVVSKCLEKIHRPSLAFSDISSLNISKTTHKFMHEIGSPSVSSLSYRPEENVDDLSFHFSSINKEESNTPAKEK